MWAWHYTYTSLLKSCELSNFHLFNIIMDSAHTHGGSTYFVPHCGVKCKKCILRFELKKIGLSLRPLSFFFSRSRSYLEISMSKFDDEEERGKYLKGSHFHLLKTSSRRRREKKFD